MGIKRTPAGLADELRLGKEKVGQYLTAYDKHIAGYTTPAYKTSGGQFNPENHDYERVALMLPQCVSGTPIARYETSRDGQPQVTAQALTFAYNHWARATNLRAVNERLAVDLLFRYGVALVTSEPRPGFEESEDQPYWPSVRRLSLKRFAFDAAALSPEQWAWSGHCIIRMRDAVIEAAESGLEKGWDVPRLRGMKKGDVSKYRETAGPGRAPDRDELAYWEMWIPDWAAVGEEIPEGEGPQDGFHGWIYTVMDDETDKKEGAFIRAKRRFFGPRWGPYVFVDGYPVPDEAVGLAPLVAERGQADYLNRIKRATMRAVEKYKRVMLGRMTDDELIQEIRDTAGDNVFKYEGEDVRTSFAQFEVGGATEQHLVAAQDARNTLDRVSGMSDALRGDVSGDATATENAIAGQASATRTGFIVGKFLEMQVRIAMSVGYYFARDEDVRIDLPPEAANVFTGPNGEVFDQPFLQGGLGEGEKPEDYEALDISIEVGSVSQTPQQRTQERLLQLDMTMDRLILMAPHAAFLDVEFWLDQRAQLASMPELRRLANTQLMQQVSGMMIAAAMQPAGGGGEAGQTAPGPSKPQERFAGDVSAPTSGGSGFRGGAVRREGRPVGGLSGSSKPKMLTAGKGGGGDVRVRGK